MQPIPLQYRESQLAFIESFKETLKYPETITPKTVALTDEEMKDMILIAEPRSIRREGRSEALAELIRRLFALRQAEPAYFAVHYTRWPKEEAFKKFLYVLCLTEVKDIASYLTPYLLNVYYAVAIEDYSIYYLTLTEGVATAMMEMVLKPLPQEIHKEMSHFFKPQSHLILIASPALEIRRFHNSIVIVSSHNIYYGYDSSYILLMRKGTEKIHYHGSIDCGAGIT